MLLRGTQHENVSAIIRFLYRRRKVFISLEISVKMERDTVCGMEVSKASKYKSEANGKVYLFCSAECKSKFDANPVKYAR